MDGTDGHWCKQLSLLGGQAGQQVAQEAFLCLERGDDGGHLMDGFPIRFFQPFFFTDQPGYDGSGFGLVETASGLSSPTESVYMHIAFGGNGRILRTVTFQRNQPPMIHIVVAIGDDGIQAAAVFAQEGTPFAVHLETATFPGHFHEASGRGQETVFGQETVERVFFRSHHPEALEIEKGIFGRHGPDGFYLFHIAHENGLPCQTERGNGKFGRHLPRLVDNEQVDGIVKGNELFTFAGASHVAGKRMERGDEDRQHAGQTPQSGEIHPAVFTAEVSGTTIQATDELGLPMMDGIPEHLITVTDVQSHGHVIHAGQVLILLSLCQSGIAFLEIIIFLPLGHKFFVDGRGLAEVVHHPGPKASVSASGTTFFLYGDLQTCVNPLPQEQHPAAKIVLTFRFVPTRSVKVTVESLQVIRAVLVHPLRLVVGFRETRSFSVQHHGIKVGLAFLAGQIQAERIQFRQPALGQTYLGIIRIRSFYLEILENVRNGLVVDRTGHNELGPSSRQYGIHQPVSDDRLQEGGLSRPRRTVDGKNPTATGVSVHGQGFALGDGQGKITAHLRQVLPVGVYFFPVRQRKQRFTFTTRQTFQQGKVFPTVQQLVVESQDILCHSRGRCLCNHNLRALRIVHFRESHSGSLTEQSLTCPPISFLIGQLQREFLQQTVHLRKGSNRTVILGIGRKKPTDKHRHPLQRVFRHAQPTVGPQGISDEKRIFREWPAEELAIFIFGKQHTGSNTYTVLLGGICLVREKQLPVFFKEIFRHPATNSQRNTRLLIGGAVAPFGIQQTGFPVFKQFFVHRFTNNVTKIGSFRHTRNNTAVIKRNFT